MPSLPSVSGAQVIRAFQNGAGVKIGNMGATLFW